MTTAETAGGSATRYTEDEPRRKLWDVVWGRASIEYDDKGRFGGTMGSVKGSLFDKGQKSAAFTASQAIAEFATTRLRVEGGIEVRAENPKLTMRCQKMTWNPDLRRIEASGTVTIETDRYRLGPFDVVYCTPNLHEIATPDMFKGARD